MKKKVSIIVPVYNTQKYLKKCLTSLVNQTLKDIEIIIINDGSKDNSEKIIKEYMEKYPDLIKYYKNENHGISYTRNFGISKANSEYITFLDSDDWMDENALFKMYNKAKNEKLDVVVSDYYKFYDGTENRDEKHIISFSPTSIKKNPNLIYEINQSPWGKLFDKKLFDNKYRFPLNCKYEDLGYIPILLCEAAKIGKIDDCLIYYRIRNKSETTTVDSKTFDIFKILNILNEYYSNLPYYKDLKEYFEYLIIEKLTTYNLQQKYNKDKDNARLFINKSFEYLKNWNLNWKKNKIYIKKNKFKTIIKNSKFITKLFIRF